MKTDKQLWEEILFGIAIADALGVPVEFKSRKEIKNNPVTDMIGYGTYNLPEGTWSDDTSLTLCLAEALTCHGDLTANTANNFLKWFYENHWTPRGTVFDVGNVTSAAIRCYQRTNCIPELAGGFDASDNGNGSLMRILPLLMFIKDMPVEQRYEWAKKISSITHAHIRSVIACFYYLEYARLIYQGQGKVEALNSIKLFSEPFLKDVIGITEKELSHFDKFFTIYNFNEEEIFGNGYVVNSLEAAVWCFITSTSYKETVLKAVNLGEDTDTTAAIAGGLAGLYYGYDTIPNEWINKLARKNDIDQLISILSIKKF